jgi:micrococcal nuclease
MSRVWWTPVLGIIVALGLTAQTLAGPQAVCSNPPKPVSLLQGNVVNVVDGDTIDVRTISGVKTRIRLLGIDTPEVHESEKLNRDVRQSGRSKAAIQAMGRLAWEYTRTRLDAKTVGLEFDVQRRDRYSRTLAYIWLADGTLFNMVIMRDGYAQVMTIPPNVKYASLFLACQREAREKSRGLWGHT